MFQGQCVCVCVYGEMEKWGGESEKWILSQQARLAKQHTTNINEGCWSKKDSYKEWCDFNTMTLESGSFFISSMFGNLPTIFCSSILHIFNRPLKMILVAINMNSLMMIIIILLISMSIQSIIITFNRSVIWVRHFNFKPCVFCALPKNHLNHFERF